MVIVVVVVVVVRDGTLVHLPLALEKKYEELTMNTVCHRKNRDGEEHCTEQQMVAIVTSDISDKRPLDSHCMFVPAAFIILKYTQRDLLLLRLVLL